MVWTSGLILILGSAGVGGGGPDKETDELHLGPAN